MLWIIAQERPIEMNREVASEVSTKLLEVQRQLNQTLLLIKENCEAEEFNRYRMAVANAMGTIFLELLNPIYEEHPHLAPPDYYLGKNGPHA
jgi:hypothetical protein